jgi:hypothetical protein
MTRKQLEARANTLGYTINGDRGQYWIDGLKDDYLYRSGNGFRTLSDVSDSLDEIEFLSAEQAEYEANV